jgi:hypothetical protein
MPTTIAQRYLEELENWSESIKFYSIEMNLLASKLYEVIRRNSVVGIAEKVNTYQVSLNNLSEKFDSLLEYINAQESEISIDGKLKDDPSISFEVDKQQSELRKRMKVLEKKFIDAKYACNNFLLSSKK